MLCAFTRRGKTAGRTILGLNTKDMTMGSPAKLILGFSMPLILGNMFQQLYTFVDTVIIGQKLGVNALAAIGGTEWLLFLLFGSISGITTGFCVMMAQTFGAKQYKDMRKAAANAIYLSIGIAIIFTIVGQLLVKPLLELLRTPKQSIEMAETYVRILYLAIPITIAYNLLAAMLRALGNSKAPLNAIIIASFINGGLDLLFVVLLEMGIAGAAIATVISEIFSVLFCFFQIRKMEVMKGSKEEQSFDKVVCIRQLKLGLPMGIQTVITAMGGLVVQSVINGFGVVFVAGFTAANKLYGLLEIAASSYGNAMVTYTGQNYGAKKYERIPKGLKAAVFIGIITAIAMSTVMLIGGKFILKCFLSGEEWMVQEALQIGYQFLVILAIFFPLLYLLYILRSCMQGMGNTVMPMVSSMAQLFMRVSCALLLPQLIGSRGVFYGEIMAWVGADIILVLTYFYHKRKFTHKNRPQSVN